MLLQHLAPENTRRFGVSVNAEAVIDGAHTLVLIVDAGGPEQVQRFMQPFAQVGSVEVQAASPCEVVIERGGCAAPQTG